jgi:hypothetical protein
MTTKRLILRNLTQEDSDILYELILTIKMLLNILLEKKI